MEERVIERCISVISYREGSSVFVIANSIKIGNGTRERERLRATNEK